MVGWGAFPQLEAKAISPVRLGPLLNWLSIYRKKPDALFLIDGFSQGFRIPYPDERKQTFSKNLKSVHGLEHTVRAKLLKEVGLGRFSGPHAHTHLPNLRFFPRGLVPKKPHHEFRLIHHLSYPHGNSVNDTFDPIICRVKYASFDATVDMIRSLGPSAMMANCVIQLAFRLLSFHFEDFDLLGFTFQGEYYFDQALPIGCYPVVPLNALAFSPSGS